MELANYILKIFMMNPVVMMSWGFHSPKAIQDGLQFNVEGYLHQGPVSITLNGLDLFDIRLLNNDGSIKQEENNVYADCLTDMTDRLVERCEDYDAKVKSTYGL